MRRLGLALASAILWLPLVACLPGGGEEDAGTSRADAGSSNDAARPDSSSGSDSSTTVPCGTVTFIGECQGNTLRWCNQGALQEIDCAGQSLICGLVDCTATDCYGYDCVSDLGGSCGLSEGDYMCNGGDTEGCLHGVCAASTACSTDGNPTCVDASYVSFCFGYGPDGTIWDYDCTGGGAEPYVCGTGSAGDNCLGVEGGNCDLTQDPPWECASGFTCSSTTAAGTCQPS